MNRAAVLSRLGDQEGAMQLLTESIASYPSLAVLYLNRGLVKELSGDLDGACADWTLARDLGAEEAREYLKECR
ncbi:MAG: hypothetical protein R2751_19965 [Bacteroidales bacterium]